jgi:hypothetical protein
VCSRNIAPWFRQAAVLAGLLTVLIIFFFLNSGRSTVTIDLAFPSVINNLIIMRALGSHSAQRAHPDLFLAGDRVVDRLARRRAALIGGRECGSGRS